MEKNLNFILLIFLVFSFQNILSKDNDFLHFDLKNDCPNPKISSLGILISLSESDDSSYENTLTQEERESYEEIIELKRSFSSMKYIPQSFSPEKEKYWKELNSFLILFIIIAMVPTAFIIAYLFLRFVLKKCEGPKKIKQVSKNYRNITWVIMVISTGTTLVLFSIIIAKSNNVRNNLNNSFNFAVDTIKKSDNAFTEINEVVEYFNKSKPIYPLPNKKYMTNFKNDINTYIDNTKQRTQQILDDESKRYNINLAIYIAYLVLIFFAYIFFFIKKEALELVISILLLFAIPGLLILEGFNAKYFFYYADICDSVNSALYSNQFPVADQSLGYYYNCFPTNTKAALYNLRYRLYENLNDNKTLIWKYENVTQDTFDPFFKCEIVNSALPKIERDFCKDSLNYMYSIVTLMTWILISGLGIGIGSRRLQVLIWKKKMEIEEMIENKEAIF